MKFCVSTVFILLISSSMNARVQIINPIKPEAKSGKCTRPERFFYPVTIKVDMIQNFTIGGVNCTDHVTGTVTLEFNGTRFSQIKGQSLHHKISCGNKTVEGHLKRLDFDEKKLLFTAAEFDPSGDEDIDRLVASPDFQHHLLEQINSQLVFD